MGLGFLSLNPFLEAETLNGTFLGFALKGLATKPWGGESAINQALRYNLGTAPTQ